MHLQLSLRERLDRVHERNEDHVVKLTPLQFILILSISEEIFLHSLLEISSIRIERIDSFTHRQSILALLFSRTYATHCKFDGTVRADFCLSDHCRRISIPQFPEESSISIQREVFQLFQDISYSAHGHLIY